MKIKFAALAVAAVVLAACGGTSGTTAGSGTGSGTGAGTGTGGVSSNEPITLTSQIEDLDATKVLLGGTNQATRFDYNSANDTIIIEDIPFDDDVYSGVYARTPALDRGAYQAYTSTNGFDTYVAYYDTSSTGTVSVGVVNSNEYADHGYSGAMFQRTGTTNLPSTTQKAYYNGNYIGLRTSAVAGAMDTITGTALMEADFSDSTMRGRITNRVMTTSETGAAVGGDIVIRNTAIDRTNGSFAGTVVQGVNEGTHQGVFGGTDATEMAGSLVLIDGPAKTREVGVYIAEQ